MSARDNILRRLSSVNVGALPSLPDEAKWFVTHRRTEDNSERVVRLRAALEAAHAELYDVTEADWVSVLLGVVAKKGIRQLLIGKDTLHGIEVTAKAPENLELVNYEQPIDTWRDLLFDDIDAGLTVAKGAIAETGSLILWPTPAEPRLMSLVPGIHFVLLDVHTIYADLHDAMVSQAWSTRMPTNALLVCGPSKTADIQQTLAYGAHGPKELVVLMRRSSGSLT
ncbi:MAG: lactate utilization protein [Rhodoferax sp.]|jgi:L-lactate dehydrogenase complex protein LldG|nr:lactate utilization protein [Rhodoferax sp.]